MVSQLLCALLLHTLMQIRGVDALLAGQTHKSYRHYLDGFCFHGCCCRR